MIGQGMLGVHGACSGVPPRTSLDWPLPLHTVPFRSEVCPHSPGFLSPHLPPPHPGQSGSCSTLVSVRRAALLLDPLFPAALRSKGVSWWQFLSSTLMEALPISTGTGRRGSRERGRGLRPGPQPGKEKEGGSIPPRTSTGFESAVHGAVGEPGPLQNSRQAGLPWDPRVSEPLCGGAWDDRTGD